MDDVREGRAPVHLVAPRGRPSPQQAILLRLSALLAVAVVLAQIAYPLTPPEPLRLLTIGTVMGFAVTSVLHAVATRGAAWAISFIIVAGGIGFLAEVIGVHTGVPFGRYAYGGSLGLKVLGVPLVVPLAWVMMAYPCLLLGRRLARNANTGSRAIGPIVALTGGLTLAAWDLFLDPQMVSAQYWTWLDPAPSLPGVAGIPITNYLGWVIVAVTVIGTLDRVLPDAREGFEAVPAALLAWTWLGSTVANAAFFHRPSVAIWGGVAMGLFAVPYLYVLLRDRLWRDGR